MTPRECLINWVAEQHKGQQIKYAGQPYFSHLERVAWLAEHYLIFGYEIGLCHDLLEDTSATEENLRSALIQSGYSRHEADLITSCVTELTDVYTNKAYPSLSKSNRKELEAIRLANISANAQTVKYADLMDNIDWVMLYEPYKAKKYLLKKQKLLLAMDKGHSALRNQLLELILTKLQC